MNLKVVIDTNLLINGSQDDYNYGNRIIDAVLEGKFHAFANRATLNENRLLAGRKITDRAYLEKLNRYFDAVRVLSGKTHSLAVVEDPEDNKLVESAVSAEAEYLISSDNHLLKLESYKGVKIVSPQQFWTRFQEETGSAWQQWLGQFMQN